MNNLCLKLSWTQKSVAFRRCFIQEWRHSQPFCTPVHHQNKGNACETGHLNSTSDNNPRGTFAKWTTIALVLLYMNMYKHLRGQKTWLYMYCKILFITFWWCQLVPHPVWPSSSEAERSCTQVKRTNKPTHYLLPLSQGTLCQLPHSHAIAAFSFQSWLSAWVHSLWPFFPLL